MKTKFILLINLLAIMFIITIVAATDTVTKIQTIPPIIKVPTLETGVLVKTELIGLTPIKNAIDRVTTVNGTAKAQAQMTAIRKSNQFPTPYLIPKEYLGDELNAKGITIRVLHYYWNPVADSASFYIMAMQNKKPVKMQHILRTKVIPYTIPVSTSLDTMSKVRTTIVKEDPKAAISQMVGKYVENYVR